MQAVTRACCIDGCCRSITWGPGNASRAGSGRDGREIRPSRPQALQYRMGAMDGRTDGCWALFALLPACVPSLLVKHVCVKSRGKRRGARGGEQAAQDRVSRFSQGAGRTVVGRSRPRRCSVVRCCTAAASGAAWAATHACWYGQTPGRPNSAVQGRARQQPGFRKARPRACHTPGLRPCLYCGSFVCL